jgi:PAS domain S-box-containing protein
MEVLDPKLRLRVLASAAAAVGSGLTVARIDADGMPLVYANPGFLRMTGYRRDEVIGHDCAFLQGPRTDRTEVARIAAALHRREPVRARLVNYRRDGTPFWNDMLLTPVDWPAGEVHYYVGLQQDITLEVEREEALARGNRKLAEQADALQALNGSLHAFSSAVAHDLRGPLGVLGSLATAAQTALSAGDPGKAAQLMGQVGDTTRQLSGLVASLLEACRAIESPLAVTSVDLSRLARDALDELRRNEPQREVDAWVEEGLRVRGDEALLRSVLTNLLSNAWKFTRDRQGARIEVGRSPGGEAIQVRDNGVGFEATDDGFLFKPFHRLHTHRGFPGTGLGLSTVRQILHRHGGGVRARGVPGAGASFEFWLPE